jgi:hypothetical protein
LKGLREYFGLDSFEGAYGGFTTKSSQIGSDIAMSDASDIVQVLLSQVVLHLLEIHLEDLFASLLIRYS